ncbi:hypothetical protein T440DRAFT_203952 [Plenodomus tracheiphilus IPT5]|uniref:Uncharacterized protein n=1 Tax=Plenodomus tracheiphilus IPT5 TaxID=1408161 RepID=A0A6A7BI30_9PLEO|nr:hypothetical protein T440DRAFT_203952 [Plenodomus tracheiphilus IPT5]
MKLQRSWFSAHPTVAVDTEGDGEHGMSTLARPRGRWNSGERPVMAVTSMYHRMRAAIPSLCVCTGRHVYTYGTLYYMTDYVRSTYVQYTEYTATSFGRGRGHERVQPRPRETWRCRNRGVAVVLSRVWGPRCGRGGLWLPHAAVPEPEYEALLCQVIAGDQDDCRLHHSP